MCRVRRRKIWVGFCRFLEKMFSKLLVLILQSVSKQTSFRSDGEKPVVVQFLVRPSKSLENLSFQNFGSILMVYDDGVKGNGFFDG